MTEFVRVKGSDGSEFTTTETAAAVFGATVIKGKDAVDANGRPLPAKPNIHKGGSVKAADTKES